MFYHNLPPKSNKKNVSCGIQTQGLFCANQTTYREPKWLRRNSFESRLGPKTLSRRNERHNTTTQKRTPHGRTDEHEKNLAWMAFFCPKNGTKNAAYSGDSRENSVRGLGRHTPVKASQPHPSSPQFAASQQEGGGCFANYGLISAGPLRLLIRRGG